MTINNIRIFLEVYKSMSITDASGRLHLTQPVVSRTIKNLEEEYESCFFERLGKRLAPTESGKLFYLEMSRIINDLDNVKNEIISKQENPTIRIGAAIMIGNFIIPDICTKVKELYPKVTLKVTIAAANELKSKLLDNELDFALIEDSLLESELKYTPFFKDEMVPVFPTGHPLCRKAKLTLKDLSKYPFLSRESGSGTRNYVDTLFSSKGLIIDTLWESSSTQSLIRGVCNGHGITILPRRFVAEYIEQGKLATGNLRESLPERTCFIVHHKDKHITKIYNDIFNIINTQ